VYLSSRQGLADLSHFIATTNDSYDLNDDTKWITFGGSYPGMMAAWARLEYPKLVHAAVSNSAPIQMRVDFSAYLDRVSFDLQYPLVGGSQKCLQIVLDGHDEIVDVLAAGYHKKIASLFHVCDVQSLLIERNLNMWVGDGVDPRSMLALTNDRDGLPTHWVKGVSHHFWTHAVKDTDSQEVKDARDIIYLKVIQWLEEDSDFLRPFL
jgi:pimeloyl-ACP methyl ester carboxylesterase